MKVLSMIQPWASLFALGEVQYETRTWKTNYRGPMAIHTSKKIDKAAAFHVTIKALLEKHGVTPDNLPVGQIIAACELTDCLKVIENHQTWAVLEDGREVTGNDFFAGDYRAGSYAWIIKEMHMLETFIPAKGQLGLWEYPL